MASNSPDVKDFWKASPHRWGGSTGQEAKNR
jgi:hypothetical protein